MSFPLVEKREVAVVACAFYLEESHELDSIHVSETDVAESVVLCGGNGDHVVPLSLLIVELVLAPIRGVIAARQLTARFLVVAGVDVVFVGVSATGPLDRVVGAEAIE